MSFIHQELAFVPGMTVIQNIMLGLPKTTPVRAGRLARDRPRGRAGRGAGRHHGAALRQREGPVDGRELAHQHLPRADPQGAPDRHGRADGLAVGQPRARSCSGIIEDLSALRRRGALRLASARRGAAALPPRDGLPRRSLGGARLDGADLTRAALVEAIVGRAVDRVAKPAIAPPAGDVALQRPRPRPPSARRGASASTSGAARCSASAASSAPAGPNSRG